MATHINGYTEWPLQLPICTRETGSTKSLIKSMYKIQ
jgi:hypothetical protein